MDDDLRWKSEWVGYLALVIAITTTLAACWFARGYQAENATLREQMHERGSCDRPALPKPIRKTT